MPLIYLILLSLLLTCAACTGKITPSNHTDKELALTADYRGVTVPCNIAPLNFGIRNNEKESCLLIKADSHELQVPGGPKGFQIPEKEWKQLLQDAKGKTLTFIPCLKEENGWTSYKSFEVKVAAEETDPYIAYRRIAPGYTLWGKMGIYQRDLTSFAETPILENKDTKGNCMNCHSFCRQDPHKMFFHLRKDFASSILIHDNEIEKLDTKTDRTISAMVYPSWHPGGNYIACSVNSTFQTFHSKDANRIEVYDTASDVVVYDIRNHRILTVPQLSSPAAFETFPTFAPDGKTLYFCTADSCSMPMEYEKVKYNICSIAFDEQTGTFGNSVDTLYSASATGKSASFPRVSPNGKWLMYVEASYGNFSIWHKDADLHMIDLDHRKEVNVAPLNSAETESYHSWSSNSHWVVFSSRRTDGLYTRPYIAYIGDNGEVSRPFVVPQEEADYYDLSMQSYNIPEFITGKVEVPHEKLVDVIKNRTAKKVE